MSRILLADDHEVMRSGIKALITMLIPFADIHEAWDGDSAIKNINEHDYQLIILDVNMPATDSFLLVSNILTIKPDAKILMFSMNPEDLYARKYLQLGARGYISKTASAKELGNAINIVLNNNRYVSPELKEKLAEQSLGITERINPFEKLTERELEVLQQFLNGSSSSDVAQILNLKRTTVSTFKARIFKKLKCENILEVNKLAALYNIPPRD